MDFSTAPAFVLVVAHFTLSICVGALFFNLVETKNTFPSQSSHQHQQMGLIFLFLVRICLACNTYKNPYKVPKWNIFQHNCCCIQKQSDEMALKHFWIHLNFNQQHFCQNVQIDKFLVLIIMRTFIGTGVEYTRWGINWYRWIEFGVGCVKYWIHMTIFW